MKHILVPTDFSTASNNAVEYAVSLAEIFNAKVTLLNVVPDTLIIDEKAAEATIKLHRELVADNKDLMTKTVKTLSKNHLAKMQGYVDEGSPSIVIIEMANEDKPDIIIMGMKGKGKSNSVFGSTVTAVVRKSSIPVWIIPENGFYQSIDTITFATDFDAGTGSDSYSLLMDIAKKYNSFIQILNVQKKGKPMSADEFIGKMGTHFLFEATKHSFHTIEEANVIEGINNFIDEKPCEILVMIAHKHSFFERMLGRVYTKKMSYETSVPLLVLQNK
ncbi:MAG TPA: universal stress protein [Hanamia sp.]|nr:universal stress protein [Hanamia sp.]